MENKAEPEDLQAPLAPPGCAQCSPSAQLQHYELREQLLQRTNRPEQQQTSHSRHRLVLTPHFAIRIGERPRLEGTRKDHQVQVQEPTSSRDTP